MRSKNFLIILSFICNFVIAQTASAQSLRVIITNEKNERLPGATLKLFSADSVSVASGAANEKGEHEFNKISAGKYYVQAGFTGYETAESVIVQMQKDSTRKIAISLKQKAATLSGVTVTSKKPFIQFLPDKTVINPEADITSGGATALDVLEKSPGITVGKDGSVIMKGKPAVNILIDGKSTQLSGADLQAYLSGIGASQIDVIELIENPGAKYDAAGNAGIINIRTKANKQQGFNGSMNLSIGRGYYTKSGNSINLNYRRRKFNWFLNYGIRASTDSQHAYTLRKYFDKSGVDSVLLEQPNANISNSSGHNLKTGFDFFRSSKTTLGFYFTGGLFNRHSVSVSDINWMDRNFHIDSSINTSGNNNLDFRRGGINLNGRHRIDAGSEIGIDLDYVRFRVNNDQQYRTQLSAPGSAAAETKGYIPSRLSVTTLKADYSKHFKSFLLETGVKTAINKTDNLAAYYFLSGTGYQPDLSRSNHFLYDEKISAAYVSADAEKNKWHWQGGLRYEQTFYKANQLGNAIVKDSAFEKNYGSIFPTGFVSYAADSNHTFTFRFGRRIDRPPFQNLNPFITTLNKYTYEAGNPFIKPQYTWNVALSHSFKQLFTTEFSYSILRDYFSQIFIIDSNSNNINGNIIIYTRGNVGSFTNFGISETYQQQLTGWWNLTVVAVFNRKIIEGVVWAPLRATVSQLNISINNKFSLKKGWAFEASGYYQTRSQIDLQEWLKPQGELNLGVSKQILKNKGSLKLSVRDLTYFQNYSGVSTFENSHEPFVIKWDSRVVRLSFNWRFGKTMKAITRSEGGATDEINRAGGN